jgi:hypothetical protein
MLVRRHASGASPAPAHAKNQVRRNSVSDPKGKVTNGAQYPAAARIIAGHCDFGHSDALQAPGTRSKRGDKPDFVARDKEEAVRKSLPDTMFTDPERSRLTMLRTWVLDNEVTEIEMKEQQFWNFAQLQPIAEKPWTTFMGRIISVPDMPIEAQKYLGIFDKRLPGAI